MVLCGGMAMALGQAPLRGFPKGEAGKRVRSHDGISKFGGVGDRLGDQLSVHCSILSLSGGAKAEFTRPISRVITLGISNDGTEDGYDDGERVKKVP